MDTAHPTWAELRVHGVSGTPPESLLAVDATVQVAGDLRSRFFRPADPFGRPVTAPDGHVLEAYHWGRWTSGSWQQGLWLLLIPFGIVNAAQFMLPAPDAGRTARWSHAVAGALLRVLALVLTALFALALVEVLVDLVAWQWLARAFPDRGPVAVVGGLLLAAGSVGLLARLGRLRTGRQDVPVSPQEPPRVGLPDLGHPAFLRGDPDSPALRRLHLAIGLQVVAAAGWLTVRDDLGGWYPAVLAAALPVATTVVVALLGDPEESVSQRPGVGTAQPRRRTAVGTVLLGLATVSVVAAAVAVLVRGFPVPAAGLAMPGLVGTTTVVLVVGAAGLAALLVATGVLAAATRADHPLLPRPFRRFAAGMLAALAAGQGLFLAVGLTAAATLAVQRAINTTAPSGIAVEVPLLLQRVAYSWGTVAFALVGVALFAVAHQAARRQDLLGRASAAVSRSQGAGTPRADLGSVAAAMGRARWKLAVVPVLGGAVLWGLAQSLAVVVVETHRVVGGTDGFELPPPFSVLTGVSSGPGAPVTGDDVVIAVGSTTLLALASLVLLVVRGAVRTTSLRRGVNTVWDVISFWPRAVHPFVPPPYSQRVVLPLAGRISWLLGVAPDPGTALREEDPPVEQVVLAAHSQGSLVTALALLWLPADAGPRVSWLTCGSQLRVLFPRAFPHYVTYPLLSGLAARHPWISLYRDTDPIGGPVTSWDHSPDLGVLQSRRLVPAGPASQDPGGAGWWSAGYAPGYPSPHDPRTALLADDVDPVTGRRLCGREWRLLDPPAAAPDLQTGGPRQLRGHSSYWTDPDWPRALDLLRAEVGAGPPGG